ncbi:MAG: amino acid racemase [Acidobacteria bacterium]|nr:amino acid racemase [Acidobacteriota bacterium]
MKTIGLVGGTGWVSTLEYYRLLNQGVNERLGGHEAARCLLYSLNYGDIVRSKERDEGQAEVRVLVVDAARLLERAGAGCLALCANTLHWFADDVEAATAIPLVHIADSTAGAIRERGMARVGLLGTRPTMEQPFYRERLAARGVEALVPAPADRGFVDDAIGNELVRAVFRPETRARFVGIMDDLGRRGAEGIVLGCTEIPLLVGPDDTDMPLFDTLRIHCAAIVEHALAG